MTSRKALTRSFEQNGAAGYKKSFAEHQKEIRLEANRRRVAESRTNEPKAVRLRRLADYRERVAKRRASETPEERQQRLENNRRRVAQKRASEDEEQRRTRLEKDRERVARKRALEKTALPPPFGVGLPLITVAKNVTTLPEELEGMSGKSLEPVIIIGSTAISNSTSEPVSVGTNGTTIKGSQPPLQHHYNEFLRIISDIGRDVKPAYTSNKVSTDKLRKNIMLARTSLRDCQADLEKLAASANAKD